MRISRRTAGLVATAGALALTACGLAAQPGGRELRPPSAFAGIGARAERSAALFVEAGKVLQHPRCLNCHPAGDVPSQGEDGHRHQPAVQRGPLGIGVAGLYCTACHQTANFDAVGVPGHPDWRLAPASMAWQARTLGEICTQIKDPARNGGRNLAAIAEHMAQDPLVGWAWSPGAGRAPAPGTQRVFGDLIKAWVDTGAVCPG